MRDLDSASAERHCAATARAFARNDTWLVPTLYLQTTGMNDEGNEVISWVVRLLHRLGVPFLAGTDSIGEDRERRMLACAAVHEELELFANAGLPPLDALRTATLNPAKFLNATDSLGTVEPGKLADLVLLDANPLADIRNTTKIRAVVADGRYFDRASLDALDPDGTRARGGPGAPPK